MRGIAQTLTVTLSPYMVDGIAEVAERDGLSWSAFVLEAIRHYVHEREMDYFYKYGSEEVKLLGIKASDIPRLVEEARAEMAAEAAERAKSNAAGA